MSDEEWVEWIDGRQPYPLADGRYLADVEVGRRVRGVERYELHRSAGRWSIRGTAPLARSDTVLRVRWLGELPNRNEG